MRTALRTVTAAALALAACSEPATRDSTLPPEEDAAAPADGARPPRIDAGAGAVDVPPGSRTDAAAPDPDARPSAEADARQNGMVDGRPDGAPWTDAGGDGPPAAVGKRWRIMPLGDSITQQKDGYRGYLQILLKEAGYEFDFVGSNKDTPIVGGDPDNEGRGGHSIGPDMSAFCQWQAATMMHRCQPYRFNLFDNLDVIGKPEVDVILLLIGINDLTPAPMPAAGKDGVYRPTDPKQAADKLAALVAELRKRRPMAKILVSSLIRLRDTTGAGWAEYQAVNKQAQALAEANPNDEITFVDLNALPLVKADFADAVHVSSSGGEKMAKGWFDALTPILGKPASVPAPAAYKDDFSTADAAWMLTNAKIASGRLTLSNFTGSAKALQTMQALSPPYTLKVRLNSAGSGFGNKVRIVFDHDDAGEHFLELGGGAMGKAVLGRRGAGAATLATYGMPFAGNGAMSVEIRRTADAIGVVATKGETVTPLFEAVKTTGPAGGKIGFETDFNHADVDEVSVSKE